MDDLYRIRFCGQGTSHNTVCPFVLVRVKLWGNPAYTAITKPSRAKLLRRWSCETLAEILNEESTNFEGLRDCGQETLVQFLSEFYHNSKIS